jgi:hypothetical protein
LLAFLADTLTRFFLEIFISSCGFGFIRTSAPIRFFVAVKSSDFAMADPKLQFQSARLKVKRADRHIQELVSVIVAFLDTDFCKLHIEEDGDSGNYSVNMDSTAPFPPEIPLIVGDAVHNLRSALDHIVVQFTKSDRLALPTGKERHNVEGAPHYRTIKKSLPDFAAHILNEIQPYAGGKFKVWELGKLDNIDKHQLLIPTINITGLMGVDFEDDRGNRISGGGHIAVEQGRIQGMFAGFGKIKINNHGKPTIGISFAPGTPFQDQTILETLPQLSELVLKAIEAIELFCFGNVPDPDPIKI